MRAQLVRCRPPQERTGVNQIKLPENSTSSLFRSGGSAASASVSGINLSASIGYPIPAHWAERGPPPVAAWPWANLLSVEQLLGAWLSDIRTATDAEWAFLFFNFRSRRACPRTLQLRY